MNKLIAIVAGEPNSINSEIIAKAWKLCKGKKKIFVIGNYLLLLKQISKIGIKIPLLKVNEIEEIQLTDFKTAKITGVTKVQRLIMSPQIMVARLQAYAQVAPSNSFTFFCGADSIFINPLDLRLISGDILLTKRIKDGLVNHKYPEFYPEFSGKRMAEVMPFLFGAIATRGDQGEFFGSLLNICLELPQRFHRWYGDQYALASAVATGGFNYGLLDLEKHLVIVRSEILLGGLSSLRDLDVQMITFKGPASKAYIEVTLKNLHDHLGLSV